ncbi:hypothetical protein QDG88_18535 [Pseudoalteromonas piscicida]|uniref:hypothetical protein n=1 Tax=Pseudoalteromonas piscicida TaxID=43662 RepID=UPI0027399D74|nr:hypothetical protein [Pseudoalteromonas piscicida]MDP4489912.1 hypothetical protein [Pseudoalteromonas piscicida]
MDLDVRIIAALVGLASSLIGITLASLISSIGYFSRSSIDKKKSARIVLYMLFEIRHVIKVKLSSPRSEREIFLDRYKSQLRSIKINGDLDFLDHTLGPVVESHTSSIIETSVGDTLERIRTPFEDALKDLAQIHPILAFKLKGIDKLLDTSVSSVRIFEELRVASTNPPPELLGIIQSAESELKKQVISEVDDCIVAVAKRCSRRDRVNSKKLLDIKDEDIDEQRYQDIEKFMQTLLPTISEFHERDIKNGSAISTKS